MVTEFNGFLRNVCFDEDELVHKFRCVGSESEYSLIENDNFSDICEDDPHFYQACGVLSEEEDGSEEALCGRYVCKSDNDKNVKIQKLPCGSIEGKSNLNCSHLLQNENKNFSIPDSKRCGRFDLEVDPPLQPFCEDFLDQTNCTVVSLVGGHCEVGGFKSSVSEQMVCAGERQLCDDNMENNCQNSSENCFIHKHRFCDGVADCPDRSDETHEDCMSMTRDQKCVRRFGDPEINAALPHSWLDDTEMDCLDGMDEADEKLEGCLNVLSLELDDSSLKCDEVCDTEQCVDESRCNGRSYGMYCRNKCNIEVYLPVQHICDGSLDCQGGLDEMNCDTNDSIEESCVHYAVKEKDSVDKRVPIHDNTRCAIFDLEASPPIYPYCENFEDQTNCCDDERLGGECEVNSIKTNISTSMICRGLPQLCDDNAENNCVNNSSECRVHKHRLCDGHEDCTDGSDETHESCSSMSSQRRCVRRFGLSGVKGRIPYAWVMDSEVDCLDELDEKEAGNWYDCSDESLNKYDSEEECDSADDGGKSVICDGKCDLDRCDDETPCNGFTYGLQCRDSLYQTTFLPPDMICDKHADCVNADEVICDVNDYPSLQSCPHYRTNEIVPIHDITRCFHFEMGKTNKKLRYCANFMDQTNCTDPEKVGGECEVNGHQTNISIYMICKDNPQLCDNNEENDCRDTSTDCKVHKHRLCDGVVDCPDASDETHEDCTSMTIKQQCVRRFGKNESLALPHSWIMDNITDCKDGMDEVREKWKGCFDSSPGQLSDSSLICNDQCDTPQCEDESDCNCQFYGLRCQNYCNREIYLPPHMICDGTAQCANNEDESECDVKNVSSCVHYRVKEEQGLDKTVVIQDKTRCGIFNLDADPPFYPYCVDFSDQTNCLDSSRVGGYCEIDDVTSTVSNLMVCAGKDKLCDDNMENNCRNGSENCFIHKHRFCDGVADCPDRSDETHKDCLSMTEDQKCVRKFGIQGMNTTLPHSWIGDEEHDCLDGMNEEDEIWSDCRESFSDATYNATLKCNNKCDSNNCEDESYCNDIGYGMWCKNRCNMRVYLPVHKICDGSSECSDGADEANCEVTNTTQASCVHYQLRERNNKTKIVPIDDRNARCAIFNLKAKSSVFPVCANFMDQTNCSDITRVGGNCQVQGFLTSISTTMICGGNQQLCDDNSENNCVNVTQNCRVHKHRLCDEVEDCEDGGDETHQDCKTTAANIVCVRRFGAPGRRSTIPSSWVRDDESDCMDNSDEIAEMSPLCGKDDQNDAITEASQQSSCREAFICPEDKTKQVNLDLFCDAKESCSGKENEVCQISREFLAKNTVVEETQDFVKNLCDDSSNVTCQNKDFDYFNVSVFGVPNTILKLENNLVDCSNKFGEHYVYRSCMGLCENAMCPLTKKVLAHDACPNQYSDRVFTIAENSKLTFVTKSGDRYHNDYFQCDNGRCLNYSQVCDLVNDCGDMSDEKDCSNHFTCENDDRHLISFQQKCDGIYDCHDYSDECNDLCGQQIIASKKLKFLSWAVGVIAVLLTCGMFSCVLLRENSKTEHFTITKTLFLMMVFGNFLFAVYTVALSIFDSIVYGTSYCRKQETWLTGHACSGLGITSTIGTEFQIFALSSLASYMLRKTLIPSIDNQCLSRLYRGSFAYSYSILGISQAVVALIILLILPLIPVELFEDIFSQGVFYQEDLRLFTGVTSKKKHVSVINEYYGGNASLTDSVGTRWTEINNLVHEMFTQKYRNISRTSVPFYGSDKLCLFRYIVTPERSSFASNTLTWMFLIADAVWLLLMIINVVCLNIKGRERTDNTRLESLERIIPAIIVADFICLAPFITACILHNLGVIDVSSWYHDIALTLLPLSSILNSLIYFFHIGYNKLNRVCIIRGEQNGQNNDSYELSPAQTRKETFTNPTYTPATPSSSQPIQDSEI